MKVLAEEVVLGTNEIDNNKPVEKLARCDGWPFHREGRNGTTMRLIKLGLISFIAIFIIILLISLLFPSQIRISRATNLVNNRARVFSLLKDEKAWHPAYLDSLSALKFARLQKTAIQQTDSTLIYVLQQEGRKTVTNGWQLYGQPSSDSLTLQWYMDFQLSWYPWEKFSTLFYEKTYGTMMEKGLANFKARL